MPSLTVPGLTRCRQAAWGGAAAHRSSGAGPPCSFLLLWRAVCRATNMLPVICLPSSFAVLVYNCYDPGRSYAKFTPHVGHRETSPGQLSSVLNTPNGHSRRSSSCT